MILVLRVEGSVTPEWVDRLEHTGIRRVDLYGGSADAGWTTQFVGSQVRLLGGRTDSGQQLWIGGRPVPAYDPDDQLPF